MNEILAPIATRRARRALDVKPVGPEILARILTAATLAPSCGNKQPWRFLVLDEPAALAKARPALTGGNYWGLRAPVLVAAITRPDLDAQLDDHRDYAFFDLGMAVGMMLVQGTAEGLIIHPVAGYDPLKIKEAFGIDPSYTVITLIIIGWPGDESGLNEKHLELEHSQRTRKPESEVIFRNSWPT